MIDLDIRINNNLYTCMYCGSTYKNIHRHGDCIKTRISLACNYLRTENDY